MDLTTEITMNDLVLKFLTEHRVSLNTVCYSLFLSALSGVVCFVSGSTIKSSFVNEAAAICLVVIVITWVNTVYSNHFLSTPYLFFYTMHVLFVSSFKYFIKQWWQPCKFISFSKKWQSGQARKCEALIVVWSNGRVYLGSQSSLISVLLIGRDKYKL